MIEDWIKSVKAELEAKYPGSELQYKFNDASIPKRHELCFMYNGIKSSATYITDQMIEDTFYLNRLQEAFVPRMSKMVDKILEERE